MAFEGNPWCFATITCDQWYKSCFADAEDGFRNVPKWQRTLDRIFHLIWWRIRWYKVVALTCHWKCMGLLRQDAATVLISADRGRPLLYFCLSYTASWQQCHESDKKKHVEKSPNVMINQIIHSTANSHRGSGTMTAALLSLHSRNLLNNFLTSYILTQ